MQVICLQEPAFYELINEVVRHVDRNLQKGDKWISGEEAMKMLRITSKATLQKYRDEDRIRFSQPDKKVILYDTDSIREFLNSNSNRPE
jgi:hypothetical protein